MRSASLLLLVAATALVAQDPVHWSAKAEHAAAGTAFTLDVTAQIDNTWHIYSVTQGPGGPFPTRFTIAEGQPFQLAGAVQGPAPRVEMDPNFGIKTETHAGRAAFRVPVIGAAAGSQTIELRVRYQACDESTCLPPRTDKIGVPVTLAAGGASAGIGGFLWLAMSMGALSLLTPCVFPMVPITVSYFTSHAAARRALALRDAAVYALGIILTFTALGVALAAVFGAAGINRFAANPWINLAITAIFLGFAVSLFGWVEIRLPSGLLTRLDAAARESGHGAGRVLGLILMGLVFSLTSFTCTAPFVGTLLVLASQGHWTDPIIGMLAFSSVFALPFFVLALAPQLLSRLPRSGGWMASVKVVMGLLEIAAAMKFLSNADLVWRWGIFSRQVVLVVWIAAGAAIVAYLIYPLRRFSLPRLTAAAGFLALTAFLAPGLWGTRLGELESFLPPARAELAMAGTLAPDSTGLPWILNGYERALAEAGRAGKLVFVDFTGYTCTNCRWMEANMFPRHEIRDELAKHVTVRLYTDGEDPLFERQQKLEQARFGTIALPLYALVRADGATVATFAGLTRDPAAFLAFLRRR